MSKTPVGGRKRKAWRLKKKHNKWFFKLSCQPVKEALEDSPPGTWLHDAFASQDYDFTRLYK